MRLIALGAVAAIAGVFSACAPKFIIVHDNNTAGSLTVIPYVTDPGNSMGVYRVFQDNDGAVDFAMRVERAISRTGLRVFERPPFKWQEEDTPLRAEGKEITGTSHRRTIDVVAMYPDTKADYIVITYANNNAVRIIRRSDQSLVATFSVRSDDYDFDSKIAHVLQSARILVDDATPPAPEVSSKSPGGALNKGIFR